MRVRMRMMAGTDKVGDDAAQVDALRRTSNGDPRDHAREVSSTVVRDLDRRYLACSIVLAPSSDRMCFKVRTVP
jgi:hypothetical protein